MKLGLANTVQRLKKNCRGSMAFQTTASLAAVAILAATTAPVLDRYVNHAKMLKAKGELKILASSLQLLTNDLGARGIPCQPKDREVLALLVGEGDIPVTAEATSLWNSTAKVKTVGSFNDYLLTNAPGFKMKQPGTLSFGWDGPYIRDPLRSDPWGNRYAASVGLLKKGANLVPVVISAGPDGIISTPFELTLEHMYQNFGDDLVEVLR